jgi:hypothetical protein
MGEPVTERRTVTNPASRKALPTSEGSGGRATVSERSVFPVRCRPQMSAVDLNDRMADRLVSHARTPPIRAAAALSISTLRCRACRSSSDIAGSKICTTPVCPSTLGMESVTPYLRW